MNKFLLILAVSLLTTVALQAQESPKEQNYIEVSTRAEKQITPDEIYLSITLTELESKGKITVEKQEADMLKALKGIKIDIEKDLTVNDMGSDLQKYFLKKNNILATKSYTLKVSTAAQAMAAMEALNAINIPDISLQKTGISQQLEKQTKDELLTEAAQKAKENAEILASAVGSKAGRAIYIQNYYSFSPYAGNFVMKQSAHIMSADAMGGIRESAPVLEVSKTSLSISVTCRFQIF